jgi:molybdopterin-guanine dinucleotide biosynthesis adapter protein
MLLDQLDANRADLILVEGFKGESFPKIELHRPSLGKPLLFPDDPDIVAVASDAPLGRDCDRPLLELNDVGAISAFVLQWHRHRL